MTKKIIASFLLSLLLVIPFMLKANAEAPMPTPEERFEQDLNTWVHKLAFCESGQNPSSVNQFDGGSPSYGYLMYKLGTFWGYNKQLKVFPELTIDLVHKYAMDKDKSVEMTKAIIRANPKDSKNWYNCTVGNSPNKIGLPPVLADYIK
jgi:hypothetical protein